MYYMILIASFAQPITEPLPPYKHVTPAIYDTEEKCEDLIPNLERQLVQLMKAQKLNVQSIITLCQQEKPLNN